MAPAYPNTSALAKEMRCQRKISTVSNPTRQPPVSRKDDLIKTTILTGSAWKARAKLRRQNPWASINGKMTRCLIHKASIINTYHNARKAMPFFTSIWLHVYR
jgi:hypothetical protein